MGNIPLKDKDGIIREAVEQYKTPLYLYDLDYFDSNIIKLRDKLFAGSGLYFSVKANPLMELCQIAYRAGCGVEIASAGELAIALGAGVPPEYIVFTGPGKTEKELEAAIEAEIFMINAESIQEIRKIQSIAEKAGKVVPIALRINPMDRKGTGKVRMSGVASQFGIEEIDLTETLFKEIFSMPNTKLCGIHVYMGTSILKAEEIYKNTEYVIELGLRLANTYSFEFTYLNVGGGFGIPYFPGEYELDIEELGRGMKRLEDTYKSRLTETKVYFESGRYLLAECGVFLIRVLYRKESKGNCYLVCDGGANFHAASAFLGRFVRGNFPMYVLGKSGNEREFYVTGPSCTPTDLVGQKVKLPQDTAEGDIIVIEKSGAYGLTYSPYGFLSHALPAEVGYRAEGGFHALISGRNAE